MERARRFFWNALTMVAASIAMRTVAVAFNAIVTSKIGQEGIGLYTLVCSVYTFAVTLAASGSYLATTRLVAESYGKDGGASARDVMRRAFLYAAFFGCLSGGILFFGARPIGLYLLGDARSVLPLRCMAVSMLPIALSNVLIGYFNARLASAKCAAAQLFEQLVRIAAVTAGLTAFLPAGMTYAVAALCGGGAIAEIASCAFLFVEYRRSVRPTGKGTVGWRPFFAIASPVALSSYVRSGLLTVEHLLIPRALTRRYGDRGIALASYGVLHGMAIPLVMYPTAILYPFNTLLVPEIAEARTRGDDARVRRLTERALTRTSQFAVLAACVFLTAARELGRIVYHSGDAGLYVRALALLVPVMYLDNTVDSILKGIGEQVWCMAVNIADSLLSILLVVWLLPRFGTIGYVYVIIGTEIFNFTLSFVRLVAKVRPRPDGVVSLLSPIASAAVASVVLPLVFGRYPVCGVGSGIAKIVTACAVYLACLFLTGGVTVADVRRTIAILLPRKSDISAKKRQKSRETGRGAPSPSLTDKK